MKKIYTLVAAFMVAGSFASKAQMDTLLYESFNFQSFYDDSLVVGLPSETTPDPMWYNYDEDNLPDGSPSGRPGDWFAAGAFADVDTTDNVVLASNSWTNNAATPVSNWLITRSVKLGNNDTLFWKSAPFQTPLYLDGYDVRLSTATNSDLDFTTILFRAAEFTGSNGTNDSLFTGYNYAPTTGTPTPFIHGFDWTYIENNNDSSRWRGVLRTHKVGLNAYAGATVFIAFHANSHDDNLLSLDDVLIRGELPNGITESGINLNLNVFPNPASNDANVQVNYNLQNATTVNIKVYDVTGKLVANQAKDVQAQGFHTESINTSNLNSGFYTISVETKEGRSTTKLIVK
jgi:hypothetical protein